MIGAQVRAFVFALSILALANGVRAEEAPTSAEETRAAFLKMIDRPKVDLAAEAKVESTEAEIVHYHFSYATEAEKRVPGILLVKQEVTTDGMRHPVVIVMHGTGGRKDGEMGLLKRFAERSFIAVAIDGRYHGERGKPADYNAAIARAFEQGREHPLYYDTVWDVMRLIDYLDSRPEIDPARIGLMGISKGGIETWLASAVDRRVAVSVPCIGVQSFKWGLDNDGWPARVGTVKQAFEAAAKSAGVANPDAAFAKRFYDRVIPGIYDQFDGPQMLPLISPRPLLTINGDSDDKNPLPGLQLCIEAARAQYQKDMAADKFVAIIEPKTGHAVTPDSTNAILGWFTKWMGEAGK